MGAFQNLDPPTLQLSIAVFSAVLASLSFALTRAMPDNRGELHLWGSSMLCSALAFASFFLRGHASAWLTLAVANLAALGMPAFGLLTHVRFRGMEAPRSFVLMTALAGWSGPMATLLLGTPMWFAVFSMSLATASLGIATAAVIWRTPIDARNAGTWLSIAAFVGFGATLAGRALLVAFGRDALPMDSQAAPQLLALFIGCLFVLCATLALVLMLAEGQQRRALENARRDGLTGVLTRGAFTRDARRHLQNGQPVALLMIDLDHFKRVNDLHGHAAGDRVLMHAARMIAGHCRATDLVGRYGGEEFCVMLLDSDETTAEAFAQRLVQDIRGAVVRLDDAECRFTISVGYAANPAQMVDDATPAPSLEALFERADRALYAAKRAGRDRAAAATSVLLVDEKQSLLAGADAAPGPTQGAPAPALPAH